jgi:hypothetical protein
MWHPPSGQPISLAALIASRVPTSERCVLPVKAVCFLCRGYAEAVRMR